MATKARHRSEVEAPSRSKVHIPAQRRSVDPPEAPIVTLGIEPERKRGSRLARVLVTLAMAAVLVPLLAFVVLDLRLTTALDRIDGAFTGLGARPAPAVDGSVTMLMLATGKGQPGSPELDWRPGDPDVVSALFVTVSGDRRQVDVDWLPLRGPIARGISDSAPSSAVGAAEEWTGTRVDHLAVIDWSTLAQLGRDNDVSDELAPGAGRGQQQAYLREVLEDTLHAEMRKEPWTLYRALHTTAEGMAVEDGWSTFDMNRLVFSLRDMRSAQIVFGAMDQPLTKIGE